MKPSVWVLIVAVVWGVVSYALSFVPQLAPGFTLSVGLAIGYMIAGVALAGAEQKAFDWGGWILSSVILVVVSYAASLLSGNVTFGFVLALAITYIVRQIEQGEIWKLAPVGFLAAVFILHRAVTGTSDAVLFPAAYLIVGLGLQGLLALISAWNTETGKPLARPA